MLTRFFFWCGLLLLVSGAGAAAGVLLTGAIVCLFLRLLAVAADMPAEWL